jgi:hypothetical protein
MLAKRTPTIYVRVTGPDSMARIFSGVARNDKGALHVDDDESFLTSSEVRVRSLGGRRASSENSLSVHTSFQAQRNPRMRKVGLVTLETSMNAAELSRFCVVTSHDGREIGVCVDPTDT